jgi:hypothetical protein
LRRSVARLARLWGKAEQKVSEISFVVAVIGLGAVKIFENIEAL